MIVDKKGHQILFRIDGRPYCVKCKDYKDYNVQQNIYHKECNSTLKRGMTNGTWVCRKCNEIIKRS